MTYLSRRIILGGGISLGVLATKANASFFCGPVNPLNGVQQCQVGLVGLDIIAPRASTVQRKQNWCWAACISGVFAWHGRSVDQSRVVEKIYGSDIDSTATGEQIFNAVNGDWQDENGNWFRAAASPLIDANYAFHNPVAAAAMSVELVNNFPLIVGTQGHATIVTSMTYVNTPMGQQITSITVRDPWPDNPRKRFLSATEFANIQLLMQVRVG